MNFDQKLASAKTLLASKGIRRPSYAPTVVAFLWRFGLQVPPPHFAGFFGTFAFAAIVFGLAWGVVMWFLVWSRAGTSPAYAAGISALVGVVIGLGVAMYYRHSARKHAIPRWADYTPADTSLSQSGATRT